MIETNLHTCDNCKFLKSWINRINDKRMYYCAIPFNRFISIISKNHVLDNIDDILVLIEPYTQYYSHDIIICENSCWYHIAALIEPRNRVNHDPLAGINVDAINSYMGFGFNPISKNRVKSLYAVMEPTELNKHGDCIFYKEHYELIKKFFRFLTGRKQD